MENVIEIAIYWGKQPLIGTASMDIYVDDIKQGTIKSDSPVAINTSVGVHKLEFKNSIRSSVLFAEFTQNTVISVYFSASTGDIVVNQSGATPVQMHFDWMDKPRDSNMVYPDQLKVSPGTASILSILIIGLGQMINGQLIKGLLMLVGAMFIGAVTSGLAAPIVWVISSIDAYMCANKLKQGQPIDRFSFF